MTPQEAIALAASSWWVDRPAKEVALFQMREKLLCMPFDLFHEAMEKALGRPVFTHEFGLNWAGLLSELQGDAEAPSFADILNLIPEDKRVVVVSTEHKGD